jgi:protein tyrosine phosphatase (PTP) superfamily phosphohydrolase (DUF442 family)
VNTSLNHRRNTLKTLLATTLALTSFSASTQSLKLDAPNVVEISSQLVTSGQPTATALGQLASLGFGAVIYLAPPTVQDAIKNEAEIVQRQGLVYINIPIKFSNPTRADFESFVAALSRIGNKKILVHCQVNMRASSMVFLHRVVVGKESPQIAYEAVARVWSPEGPWKALILSVLRKNRVEFEPY